MVFTVLVLVTALLYVTATTRHALDVIPRAKPA